MNADTGMVRTQAQMIVPATARSGRRKAGMVEPDADNRPGDGVGGADRDACREAPMMEMAAAVSAQNPLWDEAW